MYIEGFPVAVVIEEWANYVIATAAVLLSLASLLNCALHKPSAFVAVGRLSKGHWLAILAGCMLLSMLSFGGRNGSLGIFAIIGLVASLVYLLDIRPAIRDLGSNPW